MKNENTKAIYANISVMRIIATLAVIFLHTCSTILSSTVTHLQINETIHAFYFNGRECMRWSVPIFIMITGALLLGKEKKTSIQDCLKKYVFRMVIVLLVFGVPMAWLSRVHYAGSFSWEIFWTGFTDVLTMHSWDHLWYLYSLVAIYLTLPVFQILVNYINEEEEKYILFILFILNFIIPEIYLTLNIRMSMVLPFGYWVFYLLMGHYLFNKYVEGRLNILFAFFFGMAGILCLLPMFISQDVESKTVILYNNPFLALVAIMLFVFGLKIHVDDTKKWLWNLDRLCFGVYLIHPFFIHLSYSYFQLTPLIDINHYRWLTVLFFMAFSVISFFTVWILRKIPYFKKIV